MERSPTADQPSQPQAGEPFRSKGDELALKNDYNGAIVMYDAAIDNAPNDLTLLLSRATAHSMAQPPRLDLALADAEAAIRLDRKSWQAWLQKGEILLQQNELTKAAQALAMSVSFAQGTDKIVAQRALGNARARRESQPQPQPQQQGHEDLPPAYEAIAQTQSAPAPQGQTEPRFSAQLAYRDARPLAYTSPVITDRNTVTRSTPATLPEQRARTVAPSSIPTANQGRWQAPSTFWARNSDPIRIAGLPADTPNRATSGESISATSADDYETMMVDLLPADTDLRTVEQTHSTWTINDWKSLQQKESGPTFKCGGFAWQILLYPQGNGSREHVSIYLKNTSENGQPAEDWHACVQFAVVMWSPSHRSNYFSQVSKHRFNADEPDWGFTRFVERQKITWLPSSGPDRADTVNGNVNITVYMRLVEDPTGVLWHSFINYDSKKVTGMVGLRNQGATGYLNTLLQTLYCIPAFRKAIYQIPTEANAPQDIAWALQRLFYQLQTSNDPVSTRELTTSFGWSARELFVQQDILEMWRILSYKLEERMKGTTVHNALNELFCGKTRSYITNLGSRTENFWDLELNVRGHHSLDGGLRDYIQPHNLGPEEKNAEHGIVFESFPPVLNIFLKRYTYDVSSNSMEKVNDYFSFPEEFDAAPYLSDGASKSESWIYDLKGIVVHDGDINHGSYYVLLRPQQNGRFYKFNDDRVTPATKKEAIDANFGEPTGGNGRSFVKRAANAYALVYTRRSRLYELMSDVKLADIPRHIAAVSEQQSSLKLNTQQTTEFEIGVISDESFRNHHGFDLTSSDLKPNDAAAVKKYHLPLRTNVAEFTRQIAREKNLKPEQLRLWTAVRRQNRTIRPSQPLLKQNESLREACKHDQYVWLEIGEDAQFGNAHWPMRDGPRGTVLIFLKHFDVSRQTLTGVGHVHIPKDSKVGILSSHITKMMQWPDSTSVSLFEEIKPSMVEPPRLDQTFVEAEIGDGDIIIFQQTVDASTVSHGQYKNAQEYCRHLLAEATKPPVYI